VFKDKTEEIIVTWDTAKELLNTKHPGKQCSSSDLKQYQAKLMLIREIKTHWKNEVNTAVHLSSKFNMIDDFVVLILL
jgi:hypothetical protein